MDHELTHIGYHPAAHALWHLKALGVAEDVQPFESDIWKRLALSPAPEEVRVALLDTPVDLGHPNLAPAIDLVRARDFSVDDLGVFAVAAPSDEDLIRRKAFVADLPAEDATGALRARMAEELAGAAADRLRFCYPITPGAHGTAMAGLIAARPAKVKRIHPKVVSQPGETSFEIEDCPLPYAGINPFCRLIPISSALPNPETILQILHYTLMVKPHVVVIAADWTQRGDDLEEWSEVRDLLFRLAEKAIVLCAAGNAGPGETAYPAMLGEENERIIAVTACDAQGTPTGYSAAAQQGSLAALSGDLPAYDRTGLRYDPWANQDPLVQPVSADPVLKEARKVALTFPNELVSTDCRGPFGYNPSPYRWTPGEEKPYLEYHSLYCRFSGTSAATAVAAGLWSLALAEGPQGDGATHKPVAAADKLFDLAAARGRAWSGRPSP